MQILIALLVVGLIITVHELGHFLAARIFKIPVKEFAIGMGPKVYSYEGEKTVYSWRAIPMGGFVSIEGMEIGEESEDGFNKRPAYQRFIVLFAGVFMNFIFALFLAFVILMISGKAVASDKPIIGEVAQNSLAINVLKNKDEFIKISGVPIKKWDDIKSSLENTSLKKLTIKSSAGETFGTSVDVKVKRAGQEKDLVVPLGYDEKDNRYFFGIYPTFSVEKYTLISGVKSSWELFVKVFKDTVSGFKMLVTGKVKSEEVSGPIGIVKIVGEASKNGIGMLAYLVVLLSINIGIFNLLPFPALDGGRLVFVILELFGIKVNKKTEEKVHMVGMIILVTLILFVTGNDIFKFGRNS
ncbi:MAG: M50 family metallopeptidase [Fusobacteriaceae bacterium]